MNRITGVEWLYGATVHTKDDGEITVISWAEPYFTFGSIEAGKFGYVNLYDKWVSGDKEVDKRGAKE